MTGAPPRVDASRASVASATTKSSVAGGIFGGPTAAAAPEFESQLTTSSVDGGIFGGDGSLARPDVEKPRLDPTELLPGYMLRLTGGYKYRTCA